MLQLVDSNTYPGFPNLTIDFDKKIELFVDSLHGFNPNSNSFKIFYLNEVVGIDELKIWLIKNNQLFDAIITHHPDVLQLHNSYFLPRGTTWIKDFDLNKEKEFSISNLAGDKEILKGHKMRNQIHYKQNLIQIPKNFFVGNRPGCPEPFEGNKIFKQKEDLYNSQFNFAFENIKQDNWFTEKLIDCFVTKTIPIYYGCQNIGNWFDLDGIIVVDNFKEAIDVANSLTIYTYKEKLLSIEKNFELAQPFKRVDDRINELIKKIVYG